MTDIKLSPTLLGTKNTSITPAFEEIRPSVYEGNKITYLWMPKERHVELVRSGKDVQYAIAEHGHETKYATSFGPFTPPTWLAPYIANHSLRLASVARTPVPAEVLAERMFDFIGKYFECNDVFQNVAALFALHTWVYDRFDAVPYMRFVGPSGTGKSRGTDAVGALCYHALTVGGATSEASLFRTIDVIGGTQLIDEADFENTQIGSSMAKILNLGYRKASCITRSQAGRDGDYIPRPFSPFGPKIINGRRRFKDDATESRCIQHSPLPLIRKNIPIQLGPAFHEEADEIHNLALGWRLSVFDHLQVVEPPSNGLQGRTREIYTPLSSVAATMSEPYRSRFVDAAVESACHGDQHALQDRQNSADFRLVSAYLEKVKGGQHPTCKDLVAAILAEAGFDPRDWKSLTAKEASFRLRSMGFETRHSNRGAVVSIEPVRLAALSSQFGLEVKDVDTAS